MKIDRGSNLEGYAGIKYYSYLDNYIIIRPLLKYTKKDILDYNKRNFIKHYEDIVKITYSKKTLYEDKNFQEKVKEAESELSK